MSPSSKPVDSTVCVFCYKSNDIGKLFSSDFKKQSFEFTQVNKFLSFLHRFTNGQTNLERISDFNWSDCMGCCENCFELVDRFCQEYHQLKILELQLEHKVVELANIMKSAGRVPSRFIKLQETLTSRHRSSAALTSIKDFRQNLIENCVAKISRSVPRVLLERGREYISPASTVLDQSNLDIISPSDPPDTNMNISETSGATGTGGYSWHPEIKKEVDYDEMNEDNAGSIAGFHDDDFHHLEETDSKLVELELEKLAWEVKTEGLEADDEENIGDNSDEEISNDELDNNLFSSDDINDFESMETSSRDINAARKKQAIGNSAMERCNTYPVRPQRKLREVHCLASPHKCSECGRRFRTKSCLESHLSTIHEGSSKRKFKCPSCRKSFNSESSLRHHHQQCVHMQGRYPCEECGQSFRTKYTLSRHVLVHKDPSTWQFICPECDRRFYSDHILEEHISAIHTDEK